jgi:hypothetical protein
VPILADIIERLMDVRTVGRAQWWLVFASGLAWKENECPAIPPWVPEGGGGGVYLLEGGAWIFDHGFLPTNLDALRESMTFANVLAMLLHAREMLSQTELSHWVSSAIDAFEAHPDSVKARMVQFFGALAQQQLDRAWDD